MTDPLLDDRLSPRMLMKFKNLYEVNSWGMLAIPLLSLPFGLGLTRLFLGPVHRGLGNKRGHWTALSIFFPSVMYFYCTVPIPRKLYTDILTDPTLDGSYVRGAIKNRKPALWRGLSKQLFEHGYEFPEMHEVKGATEFPTDFVSSRVLDRI